MKLVLQPANSNLCGQACVAMLMNIELTEAIILIKKSGKTNLKHLLNVLKNDYQFNNDRLQRVSNHYLIFKQLPKIGLLKITWLNKKSHWIIKDDENIYDPAFGSMDLSDYHDSIKDRGRITSYFTLIKKT